jgi:hypothetical protein
LGEFFNLAYAPTWLSNVGLELGCKGNLGSITTTIIIGWFGMTAFGLINSTDACFGILVVYLNIMVCCDTRKIKFTSRLTQGAYIRYLATKYKFLSRVLVAILSSKSMFQVMQEVVQADGAYTSFEKYSLFSAYTITANANIFSVAFGIMFDNDQPRQEINCLCG